MNNLISIIIPVYNVEKYLRRCIDTVVNQTYKILEIILIDDGSTDNSGKICDEYAAKDNRIKVIHKQNGGVSSARNFGLDIAKGDYIGFVDSDDYIDFNMFEHLKYLIDTYETLISECNIYVLKKIKHKGKIKQTKKQPIKYNSEDALIKCFTDSKINNFLFNKMFHKSLFNDIRFPNGIYEDMAVMYKLISKAKYVSRSFETKYFYCVRENSLINSKYDNNRRIYYFNLLDNIINYCKKNKWSKAYNKINSEYIYMKARSLKNICLNSDLDRELVKNLRREVLINSFSLLKSSRPLYKKVLMILFSLFFYQCFFFKQK